ncbi:hypothetical protein NUU61_009169 [Penicillium alfredii]|uniref:Ferric oxidoreductase domain-containing protein n=1 Tax=Penicillium alfredii TaxID=1506179 RepID=A0A9W9EMQ2_9EURO|nr:uncharacterized protein NUU61_009169 [Penicillium alfredii]KAJ5084590.1 hypothetical protein NUU61_009169 [Penicillium alfredii]
MSFPWPYHFISLSEDEKLRRRELLDLRGFYAQWSIILAIIAIRIYRALAKAPANSSSASGQRCGPISSWDRPLVSGWIETRRHYLVCGLWLLWLLSLSVWNSGDDYLHVTKAMGHVALSQVPLQVLMSPAGYISTSNPAAPSLISLFTSISQPVLTPYHRLFGRLVVATLLVGHAALYLLFFVQSSHPAYGSLLAKRVRDFDVQCGLLALSSAAFLLLFARPRGAVPKTRFQAWLPAGSIHERRRLFYSGHLLLVVVLCVAAYYHVVQARFYMLQTLGASMLNGVWSWIMVRRGKRV